MGYCSVADNSYFSLLLEKAGIFFSIPKAFFVMLNNIPAVLSSSEV